MVDGVGTTHQVKVGSHHYLLRGGTYRKRPAPLFGARFTTGDPDYNTLNAWQYWAQTCWVGGFGAQTWRDDAMFDEGVGIDASQHEVMTLSRDLGPATRATWVLDGNSTTPKIFKVYNGKLYCLITNINPAKLYRFEDGATGSWVHVKTFSETVLWMDEFAGYLVFGDGGTSFNRMGTTELFTTTAKPSGVTAAAYTLKSYRGKLYFVFGDQIWRMKNNGPTGSWSWDGSTPFYTADDVNYVNQCEIHLGFLYFASRNGHILRTDGNNTFDLWQFDSHVNIWGLRSFDGNLYIGAAEEIEGTNSQQAVLYQFSGAAVTELKRWGKVGYDSTPGKLRAFERKLFFGGSNLLGMGDDDGFGIAAYDPIEDAFHMFASNRDAVSYAPGTEGVKLCVDDVMFYKGRLFCSVRGYGIFVTKWTFKDVSRGYAQYDTTPAGGSIASKNGGWYESSDFDGGTPGLLKLWNALTIHCDIPHGSTSIYVEVSNDGGVTYAPAGGSTATATVDSNSFSGIRGKKTIILQDSSVGSDGYYSTRLKYRITLRTTNTSQTPFLRGVIARYMPVPEPNWIWDMTLVLSEDQELLDGTRQSPDNAAKLEELRAAFRAQNLIHFTEPGGTEYAADDKPGCLILSMEEFIPHIGASSEGALEYEVRLQLLETVDEYETFEA